MLLEAAVCNCFSKISKNSPRVESIFQAIAGLQCKRKPGDVFLVEGFISKVKKQLLLRRYF